MEQLGNINIYNRERIEVTQAIEVLSSTEIEVFVKLESEILNIQGEKLKIVKLLPEEKLLSISGKINAIKYMSKMNKKSLFGKVFK